MGSCNPARKRLRDRRCSIAVGALAADLAERSRSAHPAALFAGDETAPTEMAGILTAVPPAALAVGDAAAACPARAAGLDDVTAAAGRADT